MKHARVRELLGEYLEGQLELSERGAVDEHLVSCPTCRTELRGLRATVSLLRSLPDPEPRAGLADAVMACIEAEGRPLRRARGAFRRLSEPRAAAALAAGVACFAILVSLRGDSGRPVPMAGAPTRPAPEGVDAQRAFRAPESRVRRIGRPIFVPAPGANASRLGFAALPSGVAPIPAFAGWEALGGPSPERDLDRQLELLLGDPMTFLDRVGPDARGERFARLAQHAARRGRAAKVASRLIAVPHPLANDLVPRFLAASMAEDFPRDARRAE